MKIPDIQRGMVQTALGSMFYLLSDGRTANSTNSTKSPILCFHMSPRSSDEYLEVLPLLAAPDGTEASGDDNDDETGRVVIAFDLPGYGASENPTRSCTMDEISDACLEAADSILGSDGNSNSKSNSNSAGYVAVGSLLGNFCCVSLASRHPDRIAAGIVTNPWFSPGATGLQVSDGDDGDASAIPDSFVLQDDGSHLVGLHAKRSGWLDNELNLRVVQSEIQYLSNRRRRYAKGINIEGGSDYDFVSAAKIIAEQPNAPRFLCLKGEACATLFDAFGLQGSDRFSEAGSLLSGESGDSLEVATLKGEKSTLNLVNQMPQEFASRCRQFLSQHGL
eukprot:CAMPEP_0172409686 /NCGR_PEP_ID=MMETSP1061-20121228/76493_1 /TAXON_ID=37318 /ORGANISM="Pseudo-nitzschia pungens, Strain cf. pungens" /LENGTH=334 /DNA_ID=CAMNT_0013145847 /DNA_START=283 /DNA_END=1287 /DNA_ORIENTATION=-